MGPEFSPRATPPPWQGPGDFVTKAYDVFTGTQLWGRRYDGPGNRDDAANALVVAPDGSEVFVTAKSKGVSRGGAITTLDYDASTGAQGWLRRYDGPGDGLDAGHDVGVTADG